MKKVVRAKRKRIMIPQKYVKAVNHGVKWLDVTFGRKNWLKRMNMSKFDLSSSDTCVAGNVFDAAFVKEDGFNSEDGYDRFRELMRSIGAEEAGVQFGFYTDNEKGMQYLQDLWVMKIRRLKAAK